MPADNTAAANRAHMRNAALRCAADPLRLAKAVRTVAAAMDLSLVTLADIQAQRETRHQQSA